ncbi:MAG: anion permease [Oscillospiraceae bacterium]|nr:anion permease [Oscillospiraceae bacterium]
MWIYLLLSAGLFMGWSLGTNDAANAFGTAVATRVIKYRTAVTIIAVMVVLGAFIGGANNIDKVAELSTSNKVIASVDEVKDAIANSLVDDLILKSALKAFIIFMCAALTVFVMSYLKFPVSANQSITGAIIGWGLFHADYSDPAVLAVNMPQIGKFASTWILNPLGAGIISFVLVLTFNKIVGNRLETLKGYDTILKFGYLGAGAFASFSIGLNSSANVTALYYDAAFVETGVAANLLTDARVAATIGGIAIAIGVLTFSKRVMMTVGSSIADINQIEGFLVIIAMALTVVLMGSWMGIPVSTSQAVVGAVMGAGLTKGVKHVHFGVFKNIAIAWVSSPTVAGVMAYLVALATQGFFK